MENRTGQPVVSFHAIAKNIHGRFSSCSLSLSLSGAHYCVTMKIIIISIFRTVKHSVNVAAWQKNLHHRKISTIRKKDLKRKACFHSLLFMVGIKLVSICRCDNFHFCSNMHFMVYKFQQSNDSERNPQGCLGRKKLFGHFIHHWSGLWLRM